MIDDYTKTTNKLRWNWLRADTPAGQRNHQGEDVNQLPGENAWGTVKASATENVCRCLQYHDFPMEGLKSRPGPVAVLSLAKRAIIACLNPTCLARLGSPTQTCLTPHNLRRNTFLQCCPIKRRQSLCHSGGILTSTVAGQKKENIIGSNVCVWLIIRWKRAWTGMNFRGKHRGYPANK